MGRLVVDGDDKTLMAVRQLLKGHPTLTVRDLSLQERAADDQQALRAPDARHEKMPIWCLRPSELHANTALPALERHRNKEELHLFTDGSASGNPGPCGMAVVAYDARQPKKGTVGFGWGHPGPHTSNQAELSAFVSAMHYALIRGSASVTISTDSQYISANLPRFEERRARNTLSTVKNAPQWMALLSAKDALAAAQISFCCHWIRGHDGTLNNERADRLAVMARKQNVYLREDYCVADTGEGQA